MPLIVKALNLALLLLISSVPVARAETLNILCWEGYAPAPFVDAFTRRMRDQYSIDLQLSVTYVNSPGEFFEKLRSREADLISPAHNIPKSMRWPLIRPNSNYQLVLPINLENIPNYQDLIPSLKKLHFVSLQDNLYGVPVLYGAYALMYNRDKLSQPPSSWTVLWEPEYRDQYAISQDYAEANIYVTALALGYRGEDLFSYDTLIEDPLFKQRLGELARHASNFWRSVDKASDLKGLTLSTGWGFSIPELNQQGESWRIASPKEGSTGWVDHWMIGYSLTDKPLMRKVAEEWINYTLSPGFQAYYARTLGQHPVNPKALPLLTTTERSRLPLQDIEHLTQHLTLWRNLSTRDQNGFKRLWQNALNSQTGNNIR
jgi:spermidine/putrescine transport system substrate-binding protein